MLGLLKTLLMRRDKMLDYSKELQEAIDLQLKGELEKAYSKYIELYNILKKCSLSNNLAVVINNLVALEHKLNKNPKKLYKELLELRFRQFLKNEEAYAKEYIYTLIMGVDLLNEPKENLIKAKKILNHYQDREFYNEISNKIKELSRD